MKWLEIAMRSVNNKTNNIVIVNYKSNIILKRKENKI